MFLRDIWPTQAEIDEIVGRSVKTEQFTTEYGAVFEGSDEWRAIASTDEALYEWDPASTYVQEPPFFMDLTAEVAPIQPHRRGPGAAQARRLGDDRPHQPGRRHRTGHPGRSVPHRQRASSGGCSTATAPVAATTG